MKQVKQILMGKIMKDQLGLFWKRKEDLEWDFARSCSFNINKPIISLTLMFASASSVCSPAGLAASPLVCRREGDT